MHTCIQHEVRTYSSTWNARWHGSKCITCDRYNISAWAHMHPYLFRFPKNKIRPRHRHGMLLIRLLLTNNNFWAYNSVDGRSELTRHRDELYIL